MEFISIFNDVLGPVMPGPSSSHTAGSYYLGRLARSLLAEKPVEARVCFDPRGSYARVYRAQAVEPGFAAGLLGWPLTDRRFCRAAAEAGRQGLRLRFRVMPLGQADHPNFALIILRSGSGQTLVAEGRSVGGGAVFITRVNGWKVALDGKSYEYLVEVENRSSRAMAALLGSTLAGRARVLRQRAGRASLFHIRTSAPLPSSQTRRIGEGVGIRRVLAADPVFFVQKGPALFSSAAEMVRLARKKRASLGRLGLAYETRLLGLTSAEALSEMLRRYDVMRSSAAQGLAGRKVRMKLLAASAGRVWRAAQKGTLAAGGLQAKAAARALAVMHVSTSGGIVCAAPTGGSAGALAGAVMTMAEDRGLSREHVALGLFAASAIGLVIARRATFAAESAGCQVEIGAAGAMAAAAVADMAGATAGQACDAAAISFQNSMGSVCDLVQGLCEIPCHTRNAAAAAAAFVNADLILGGYQNPIPLDETIDAVLSVGRMLPDELRCTARGGLALAPAARRLGRARSRASFSRRAPRA